ncbi:MAG TPA: hypothetical protein DCG75_16075 [Bacteroidales bacterium]|nr:hypothetical protein [Bacteroidales bacterium]
MNEDQLYVKLYKASPYFIYLFIPSSILYEFPKIVIYKRNKALQIALFCARHLKIPMGEMMQLLYEGVEYNYKKTPKSVLIDLIEGKANYINGESGAGEKSGVSVSAIVDLINWVKKLFNKASDIKASVEDSPAYDDFKLVSKSLKNTLSKNSTNKDSSKDTGSKVINLTQSETNPTFTNNTDPGLDSQRVLNLTQPESSSKNSNSSNFSKQNQDYSLQRINQPQKASMGGILMLSLLLGGLLLSGRKKKRK